MHSQILSIIRTATGEPDADLAPQPKEEFGHYTTTVAMRLGKARGENPLSLAKELAEKIKAVAPEGLLARVEVAPPGFINIWLSDDATREEFGRVVAAGEEFGKGSEEKGKRVMVEYTDPNPFKQFHIGHLMTNTIGESLARIHEAAGAEVLRVNYQGDVGLHVAKSVWGMMQMAGEMPQETALLEEKSVFLGRAYAAGSKAYDPSTSSGQVTAKEEIDAINKKIYERSDAAVNELYDRGRRWSLEYFETIYARLGTKFVHYFFESEVGPDGVKVVAEHPDVFKKSEGAVIFPGEEYGLHSRVFINSLGLPTYEAKELGLNAKKFELYRPDASLIVTGNEINEYFKVLLKAMELTVPEAAAKTRHVGHGMLRLPTGKMSSRTGDVITAEWLLDEIKKAVGEKMQDREGFTDEDREEIKEQVAIAAIRYSILRQGMGKDIIFDIATSVAFHGDSGPYLQYTYARLARLTAKSKKQRANSEGVGDVRAGHLPFAISHLQTPHELRLMRKMFEFPEEVRKSATELSTNNLTTYLFELANFANRFYEDEAILTDENVERRAARLLLADTTAGILKRGLHLLGIKVLEAI